MNHFFLFLMRIKILYSLNADKNADSLFFVKQNLEEKLFFEKTGRQIVESGLCVRFGLDTPYCGRVIGFDFFSEIGP